MTQDIQNVAVIGAGIMGHGIAQVCAQAGKTVALVDSEQAMLTLARARIESSLALLIDNGLLPGVKPADVLANVRFTDDLGQAVKGADLIFEAIPERLELKTRLYERLDEFCNSSTIFASNTSAMPIGSLAKASRHPERVIGTHFFNPAQLIPLVEVVPNEKTLTTVVERVMSFLTALGKKPIHVKKDLPGFLANRLQHALGREAVSLVQNGVASPEDVDAAVRTSIALRLIFSGPVEQRDLNGLDTYIGITKSLYPSLEDMKETPRMAVDLVAEGHLGLKTGKGFYDWAGQDVAEVAERKNRQVVSLLKFLKTVS
jgi:3-hydroxybutyryl-CoA dehydrogenase